MVLAAGLALVTACGGTGGGDTKAASSTPGGAASGAKPLTIAVVPKGTSHEFWKAIHAGAMQASQELAAKGTPVTIIWKGPFREDDREQQVQVVEGFTSQGVSGIVLAPLDDRALVRPVEEARRAGVPTLIVDSGLQTDSIVSFVATDDVKGGRLAADRLGELLGGKGRALMLRYQEGSASTTQREQGFVSEMKTKFPGITVVSSDQYSGPTRETAKRASENLLNRYGGDLQGVFTPNESSSIGMMLALQDIGKVGKVHHVGFDAGQVLVDALRARRLDGLVVQNPMRMGYLGVTMLAGYLRGGKVERLVDTGVMLVTPENMDTPEARALLDPPVAKYLGAGG